MSETAFFEAYAPDLQVTDDGRVEIPNAVAEHYGIDPYDRVDAVIIFEGQSFVVSSAKVQSRRRISIPSRQRKKYGIEADDYVTAYLYPAHEPEDADLHVAIEAAADEMEQCIKATENRGSSNVVVDHADFSRWLLQLRRVQAGLVEGKAT